jgi:hypothetical protein
VLLGELGRSVGLLDLRRELPDPVGNVRSQRVAEQAGLIRRESTDPRDPVPHRIYSSQGRSTAMRQANEET